MIVAVGVALILVLAVGTFAWTDPKKFVPATVVLVTVGLAWIIIGSYRGGWSWTGFADYRYEKDEREEFERGKTLWDWLQLLVVPAALAGLALIFNQWQSSNEELRADQRAQLAVDGQRQQTLQSYIDEMSELILEKRLRQSKEGSDIRILARTRTLSTLRGLDGARKGTLLLFLQEAGLIARRDPIVKLERADLSGAHLEGAYLIGAHLVEVDLSGADLSYAELFLADLSESTMKGTCLRHTKFAGADISRVGFFRSDMSGADLESAFGTHTHFGGTDLSDVKLTIARLKDAVFGTVIINEATNFNGPTPDGASTDRSLIDQIYPELSSVCSD